MRIIAGKWRSRRLARPPAEQTRPMPDRVKETIFNILGNHYGTLGELPPIPVADVFAGSGSMGLEALSRGAARCVFFERDRAALTVLRGNIAELGAESTSAVEAADAWASAGRLTGDGGAQLIFLDPPYRDSLDPSSRGPVRGWLSDLAARDAAGKPSPRLVVLHHPAVVVYELTPDDAWHIADDRILGSNRITFFTL